MGNWSLGIWKRQLKLKSVSTLTMILHGQRHPGKKLIQQLIEHFDFNSNEKSYFEYLVELQKKTKNLSSSMLMLLSSPERVVENSCATDAVLGEVPQNLLFKRFTHILREMTLLKNFKPQSDWISEHLLNRVSSASVALAIGQLVTAGFLVRTPAGELKINAVALVSRHEDPNMLLNFHKEILAGSLNALTQVAENQRSFNVTFLNVRTDKIGEAKLKILEFQNEFSRLFEEQPGQAVYQLSLQFFPITKFSSECSQKV